MISLEHIKQLQEKVTRAVEHMATLQEENDLLRSRIGTYETRIAELERLVESFKNDQSEIEQGILSALSHLDSLEHVVDTLRSAPASADVSEAPVDSTLAAETSWVAPAMEPVPQEPALAEHEAEVVPTIEAFELETGLAEEESATVAIEDEEGGEENLDLGDKQLDIF